MILVYVKLVFLLARCQSLLVCYRLLHLILLEDEGEELCSIVMVVTLVFALLLV